MKNLAKLLAICIGLCLPIALQAQNKDERYLAGAVPEVNGEVVFTKEFSIPGMAQDEIYERMLQWMDTRLKKNENNSRVIYTDKEKGLIAGTGDEWIVFSSSALSLDRTRIIYQPIVTCQPAQCTVEINKIRFIYREGEEKYKAEEWITDKYALNKSKTKLVRGLAKWRRKTVDFMDNFFAEAAEALSNAATTCPEKQEGQAGTNSQAPVVIVPQNKVMASEATPQKPSSPAPSETATQPQQYRQVSPQQLPDDAIQPGAGKLVIVIGKDPFNMLTMTANAGGSLGSLDGKKVVFTILSPDQPHEQMEQAETYTVRFYPNGYSEPSIILECRKQPAPAAIEGMPRTYVGEILTATIK